jgi:uncharacterized protein YbcI
MGREDSIKQQIEEAVATFAYDYMGVTPKSVVVDIHSHSVLTTLQGIIPPVEKAYAEDEPAGRDLLEKCYNNVFNVAKKAFESALENILGQVIQSSILTVNPESGDGVMIFNLADRSPVQEQ